jgi:hypothetical protein
VLDIHFFFLFMPHTRSVGSYSSQAFFASIFSIFLIIMYIKTKFVFKMQLSQISLLSTFSNLLITTVGIVKLCMSCGPNPIFCLFFINKFIDRHSFAYYWGLFYARIAGWNNLQWEHMPHKAWNIHYLVLYRKHLTNLQITE